MREVIQSVILEISRFVLEERSNMSSKPGIEGKPGEVGVTMLEEVADLEIAK